ncbi:MAG TPA: hypothetical protein VNO70_01170 [Blastocatellia bacterium]|nr:hypothetical protein [Blastocatellia bacterium]
MSRAEESNRMALSAEGAAVAAPESAASPQLAGADLGAGNSLDKIRDILFGAQARDYEKRFLRLEERLMKESADLREEVGRRFDALEIYFKKEIESLTDRLKAEQNERDNATQELSVVIQDIARAFDKKATQLDEQITKSQRELREQLLEQSKSLGDDIRRKTEALAAALDREARDLRLEKTDRAALAAMFTELAMRLNNEFRIPGAQDIGND